MEVSSRELCYGYSRNFFLFCWVQTMFLFMDKRFEKAGKEVVWSCLWQCFHQGTGLQQYACACAYNVLSSGHSLVAMMLYLYLYNLQYACGNVLHQSTGLRQCACACNCNPVMCLWQGAFNRALAGQGKGGFETLHKQTTTHCKQMYIIHTGSL